MRPRPKVLLVAGTRPEALKLAPVVRALRVLKVPTTLVATGQHPSVAAEHWPAEGMAADVDLAIHRPGQTPAAVLAAILERLPPVLRAVRPAMLVVQGDTTSALGGALAAFYEGVPVAHVEAGLRTHDLGEPFPEEGQRAMIARIATLSFAPTALAAGRLRGEGIAAGSIFVTGNTAIDALVAAQAEARRRDAALALRFPFADAADPPLVVATVHRRENGGARLDAIASGLARVAGLGLATLAMPLHPNPESAGRLRARLAAVPNIHLLPPLEHVAMVWLLMKARLLLTDSGGLQEEAPALGLRTLVLRQATERSEAVAAGVATLVPLRAAAIARAVSAALAQPVPVPVFPFGDGRAGARIASAIADWLGAVRPLSGLPALPSGPRIRESSSQRAEHRRS
jgi:UDP-N-acetylglucosamine 2-epimerase (non-hydrolysing)